MNQDDSSTALVKQPNAVAAKAKISRREQLLVEGLRRRVCRRSFREWCLEALADVAQKPAPHHDLIIQTLEDVAMNRFPADKMGAIILLPPGSAKSTYSSVCFPPWFLALRPNNNILACSFNQQKAEEFGKKCRTLIEAKKHILGYSLSKHSQAAAHWATDHNSWYFATGVGSGIAGYRADLGLIDDYLGNQEDADSKLIRDKQWDWFLSDFWPRLKPGAKVIIIANRRHEDDLVGRLLDKNPDKWHVIKIPFFAEDNDPLGRQPHINYNSESRLWPEWFSTEQADVVREMSRINGRVFAGLYQQRPAPEEGEVFKQDWLVTYQPGTQPKNLRYYIGSDHAVRAKEENDCHCIVVGGMDENGKLWIVDWWWQRADTSALVEQMIKMAAQYEPQRWFAGSDHITGSIGPFLHKRMVETNTFFPLDEVPPGRADKVARAQSIAGRCAAKMVMFPTLPTWDKAKHELLTFPGGTHDDFVDALAELGRGLAKSFSATSVVKPIIPDLTLPWQPTGRWLMDQDRRQRHRESLLLADN